MTNWKLPSHLEFCRELINYAKDERSLEEIMSSKSKSPKMYFEMARISIRTQVDLLQRLYDAGKLK